MRDYRIPDSTYRLQLNASFTFEDVAQCLPYFKQLGISDLYLSPVLQSQPNSIHGYDTIDFKAVDPKLGGMEGLMSLLNKAKRYNIGVILDFVPNHMAATKYNLYWQDVVKNKLASEYSYYFDVDYIPDTNQLYYRKFFDINELVCLNLDDIRVFNITHMLITKILSHPAISGIRIDHIDGINNPSLYLTRLKNILPKKIYIIAEKILAKDERLRWEIDGTTGYDFINEVNQLYIDSVGLTELVSHYNTIITLNKSIGDIKYEKNKFVLRTLFNDELEKLVGGLHHLAGLCDVTLNKNDLAKWLAEISACLRVYRTYIDKNVSATDNQLIQLALIEAKNRNYNVTSPEFDFIKSVLLLQPHKEIKNITFLDFILWIRKWQHLTVSMTAKGFEDTTCYCYNSLLSLNEVGSDPEYYRQRNSDIELHQFNQYKQSSYPHSINTLSTHDTKRSEDVRARINVLTEMPNRWNEMFHQWHKKNENKFEVVDGITCPTLNEELFIYQSLLGGWPLHQAEMRHFKTRFTNYMIKALREAKEHSSWHHPNLIYENAVTTFIHHILDDQQSPQFLRSFKEFFADIAFFGMLNSLSQTTLKMTCPGIPDLYQGSELWRFDFADPDNRQPINISQIQSILSSFSHTEPEALLPTLLKNWGNGQIKLYLIYKILAFRQNNDVYLNGAYLPLEIKGKFAKHLFSFARVTQQHWAITIVPRLLSKISTTGTYPLGRKHWQDTQICLPTDGPSLYHSILTNQLIKTESSNGKQLISASSALDKFPVCVLDASI